LVKTRFKRFEQYSIPVVIDVLIVRGEATTVGEKWFLLREGGLQQVFGGSAPSLDDLKPGCNHPASCVYCCCELTTVY
jgi:hypothetical protein